MNKKAIAILGAIFLLIVGTLGFLVYSKYANKTPAGPTQPVAQLPSDTSTPPTTGGNYNTSTAPTMSTTPPATTASGAVQLTTDQVVSPALLYDGSGIAYFDNQGNVFQATLQNNNGQLQFTGKKQLNFPAKAGITKILWPSKGKDFIAEIAGTSGITYSYFNGDTGIYTDLPPQIESLDWMPTADKIMYVWLQNGKSSLSIADPDAKNFKTLAPMWQNDDSIHVSPDGTQVLYYETTNSGTDNSINSVTSDGKIWKGLIKNGKNFGVLWSPDSQKFLFSKMDLSSQRLQLWLYNLTSGEVKNLGLFGTVDKAVWDKDSNVIYAAVPNSAGTFGNALTEDSFFRMDTTTMEKKQFDAGSNPIDGLNLFLNGTGDKLFFKNAQDGGLYYLDVSQQ